MRGGKLRKIRKERKREGIHLFPFPFFLSLFFLLSCFPIFLFACQQTSLRRVAHLLILAKKITVSFDILYICCIQLHINNHIYFIWWMFSEIARFRSTKLDKKFYATIARLHSFFALLLSTDKYYYLRQRIIMLILKSLKYKRISNICFRYASWF